MKGRGPSRRSTLQGALAAALCPSACTRPRGRSTAAQALIDNALLGLDTTGILDAHVHIVGLGTQGSGCTVNPNMLDAVGHPVEWARFQIYQHASGVTDLSQADNQYVDTLLKRLSSMPVRTRALIYAFDQVYGADGALIPGQTIFYTPNDYVLSLAAVHSVFVPVASVHPYRLDAADELNRVADAGAVAVKWLPNAQRFDPASPQCDAAFRVMQQRSLPLITHAGHELAVESTDAQRFGDPLRLRRALDAGVTVVVAHCASLGEYPDTDDPAGAPVSAFDLFLRLMDTAEYRDRLYGEISAVTLFNRVGDVLERLLKRTDLHHRLIHGSDYPLPAIDPLIQTWQLVSAGVLAGAHRAALSELFDDNPLLFDFVLKRTLGLGGNPTRGFPSTVFQAESGPFSAAR